MSTPHNAAKKGDIAQTVLLPGDPLRARMIANNYLENPVQFNAIRNMLGFTGTYKGKRVSVMGTGMGMPSIGIYTHELIYFYGARNLIRIGSCGAINRRAKVGNIIMAQAACTDSLYAHQYRLPGTFSAIASFDLLSRAVDSAKERGLTYLVGNVVSTDIFYYTDAPEWKSWAGMGCLAVEMEAYALYCNAARASESSKPGDEENVRSLALLTVSDHLITGDAATADERQNTFTGMVDIALDVVETEC